ncbi:hypothetical protein AAE478_006569 [Parahypoxylon ruwenzoriense]
MEEMESHQPASHTQINTEEVFYFITFERGPDKNSHPRSQEMELWAWTAGEHASSYIKKRLQDVVPELSAYALTVDLWSDSENCAGCVNLSGKEMEERIFNQLLECMCEENTAEKPGALGLTIRSHNWDKPFWL